MTDKTEALANLVSAYVNRGTEQEMVRARYAQFEREMAEAKQRDIDRVAQALVEAWEAGASVASTGRAMGSTNIYASRRAYYNRAKELQGLLVAEDEELLESMFRQARGEDVLPAVLETEQEVRKMNDEQYTETPAVFVPTDNEAWVSTWTVSSAGPDAWTVDDPQGKVASINLGKISGFRGVNVAEFFNDTDLHEALYRVYPETDPANFNDTED